MRLKKRNPENSPLVCERLRHSGSVRCEWLPKMEMEPENRLRGKMAVNNRGSWRRIGAYLMGSSDRRKTGSSLTPFLSLLAAMMILLPSVAVYAGEPFSVPNAAPPAGTQDTARRDILTSYCQHR